MLQPFQIDQVTEWIYTVDSIHHEKVVDMMRIIFYSLLLLFFTLSSTFEIGIPAFSSTRGWNIQKLTGFSGGSQE